MMSAMSGEQLNARESIFPFLIMTYSKNVYMAKRLWL